MRLLWLPVLATAAGVAGGQSLERRIANVRDGTVRMTYAARPGVCGDGRETVRFGRVITGPSMFGFGRSDMRVCYEGPVRVSLGRSDGETISIRAYVGGRWSGGDDETDLGVVSAPEAARYLLREATRVGRNGERALDAAVFADSIELWPDLVTLARTDGARDGARQRAISWLAAFDEPEARRALHDLVSDRSLDEDLRGTAIVALAQERLPDEDVDWLRRLYPSLSTKLRDNVFLAMSQSESPRASSWLRAVVTSTDESEHAREQALFWLGQGVAPTADLVQLYDKLREPALRSHYTFVLSQRRDSEALDKLMDVAQHDQSRDVRKQALFWLGQSKDPRAIDFLRDMVIR